MQLRMLLLHDKQSSLHWTYTPIAMSQCGKAPLTSLLQLKGPAVLSARLTTTPTSTVLQDPAYRPRCLRPACPPFTLCLTGLTPDQKTSCPGNMASTLAMP